MRTFYPMLIAFGGMTCTMSAKASEGAAGPDQSICALATVLAADPLEAGQAGTWSVISGSGVFSDEHNPSTQITGLSPGENELQWIVIGDGPPQIDQLVVTVYDPSYTAANAGQDSVLCLPVDTMHLYATPASLPAIGSWTSVGIALIDVPTDPHSPVEFPAGGTIQMIWTVFNGTCGQVSDTTIISVEECVIAVPERAEGVQAVLTFDPATRTIGLRNAPAGEELEVLDLNGRVVYRARVPYGDVARMILPVLLPGSYLARLQPGGPRTVLRFVIGH